MLAAAIDFIGRTIVDTGTEQRHCQQRQEEMAQTHDENPQSIFQESVSPARSGTMLSLLM